MQFMTNKHSLVSAAAEGRMPNKDLGIMYAFVLDMPEAGNRERREKYTNAGNRKSHKKKIISGRK